MNRPNSPDPKNSSEVENTAISENENAPLEEEEFEERDDTVIVRALYWSLVVAGVLALVAGSVFVWWNWPEPPQPVAETEIELPEVRAVPSVEIPSIPFTEITEEAGIDFVHENGAYGDKLLPETMGGGCAFFDFNNDGHQDILFVNSRHWPWDPREKTEHAKLALYQNDGKGNFSEVTEQAGLDVSLYGMGVAAGDYDNDGNVDLFISALGPNRLFRNTGKRFVDVTQQADIAGDPNRWSTSCGWFDYDNDADLDLFVCNYLQWSKQLDLSQNFQLTGGGRAYGRPQDFGGTYPYLYRNDGNGKFTDVSAQAGIQIDNPATGVPLAKSLGVSFADFDNDGWMDIVVANDTVQNLLLHNQQDGTFRENAALTGIAFDSDGSARGAMGIDAARFRNNDSLGVAIGNFSNEMTALYVTPGNELQFTDEAVSSGLGPSTRLELTFGVFFFDADLDGRLDLFAANGHLEEDIHKVQESQFYEQPPQLFWNCGPEQPTEFVPLSAEKCGEDFIRRIVGRGASFADIDHDGDLDILIVAGGRKPRLLRNDQSLDHHWLRVKLVGQKCNRDAIGSWVEVHLPDRILAQQVMPTRSYISQVELPLTFGLGSTDQVEKLVVRWQDGSRQEITDVQIDQTLEIKQPLREVAQTNR